MVVFTIWRGNDYCGSYRYKYKYKYRNKFKCKYNEKDIYSTTRQLIDNKDVPRIYFGLSSVVFFPIVCFPRS